MHTGDGVGEPFSTWSGTKSLTGSACCKDVTAHLLNHRSPDLISITSVGMSPEEDYQYRRRRYATLMAVRAVCVLAAVITYQFALVVSLLFIVAGAVLPWCAVLIANERMPQAKRPAPRAVPGNRPKAIEAAPPERIIDL